jgi:hypothetical protein
VGLRLWSATRYGELVSAIKKKENGSSEKIEPDRGCHRFAQLSPL